MSWEQQVEHARFHGEDESISDQDEIQVDSDEDEGEHELDLERAQAELDDSQAETDGFMEQGDFYEAHRSLMRGWKRYDEFNDDSLRMPDRSEEEMPKICKEAILKLQRDVQLELSRGDFGEAAEAANEAQDVWKAFEDLIWDPDSPEFRQHRRYMDTLLVKANFGYARYGVTEDPKTRLQLLIIAETHYYPWVDAGEPLDCEEPEFTEDEWRIVDPENS